MGTTVKMLKASQALIDQLEQLNENVSRAQESLDKIELGINRLERFPQFLQHEKQDIKKELGEIRKQLARLHPDTSLKEKFLQMGRALAKLEDDRLSEQNETTQHLNRIETFIKTDVIQRLNAIQSLGATPPRSIAKLDGNRGNLSEGKRKFRSLIVGIATAADVIAAGTIAWGVINSPTEIIYRGFYVVVLFFVLVAIVLAAFALKMD